MAPLEPESLAVLQELVRTLMTAIPRVNHYVR